MFKIYFHGGLITDVQSGRKNFFPKGLQILFIEGARAKEKHPKPIKIHIMVAYFVEILKLMIV
jgi:hypothetical protein